MAERLYRANVLVCGGTGCVASGSHEVMSALTRELKARGLEDEVKLVQTGCRGFCAMGPVMIVYPEGIFYCKVQAADVPFLVEETLIKGRPVTRLLYQEPDTHQAVPFYQSIPFYSKQQRIVLGNCGMINPDVIDEYIARGGYSALAKALSEMTREEVIKVVKDSGLRGRGGAGFLTGLKWEFTAKAPGDIKYVVCNADEGDPGAFMDRAVIEGDPHRMIEGLAIAAYAIGASKAYVYLRAEYPLAIKHLQQALKQAKEIGLLGENILDSGFDLEIKIKMGAGAFVCGEETALIHSIEGKRGMPRPRPPYPSVKGLFGKPTAINNVETLANVPALVRNGEGWFSSIGTATSKGTKVFALSGNVSNTGLVEVAMGTSLRKIIFEIGGGIPKGRQFKSVQIGGPSGGCMPTPLLDTEIDYESLKSAGAMMGSGGMVVMDDATCMVDVAKYFMDFIQRESCGKCIPCREGTRRMLEILTMITKGRKGEHGADALERFQGITQLERLAEVIKDTSLCGLGNTSPNPILSTLRWFKPEYEAHIYERRCPAGVCPELLVYSIDADKCTGCTLCAKNCPAASIMGAPKSPHYIITDKCISCGTCFTVCRFGAVSKS